MVPGGPPLEEPGPQLALLGTGQAHHVLRVVGRALDERKRLEHRVVYVSRHLRPLLGQGAGLPLGDQVADEAEPPRAEDDDDSSHDEHRPADRSQGGRRGVAVVHDEKGHTGQTDEHPNEDTDDDDAPAVSSGVLGDEGDDVVVEEGPSRTLRRCAR